MADRVRAARDLLHPDGTFVCAIDENEQERLGLLFEALFPAFDRTCVSIVHNPRGIQGAGFSYTHEYAYFVNRPGLQVGKRALVDEKSKPLMKTGGESERASAKNCFYPIYVMDGQIVRFGEVARDGWSPSGATVRIAGGEIEVWPISSTDGKERKWRYARQSIDGVREQLEVRPGRGGEPVIYLGKTEESYRTVWSDAAFNAAEHGSTLLSDIVSAPFSFPKSLYTVTECLQAAGCADGETVVDYFAGSGTTGHAAIHLNRQDGGRRRFVLVEMGQYFDTVLLPRIKKIAYAPEWKDCKPKRQATEEETARGPRLMKYFTLESYDDSLANIDLDEAAGQPALHFDDYLLNYMLKWETKASNTFLNIESIADPFSYKLRVVRDGRSIERAVDLPETFASVLGLRTRTRRVLDDAGRRYLVERGTIDHREVAVIWRNTASWSKADFERDRKFVADQKLTESTDDVFVNGDSTIPGAKSLDPIFKARMFAPVSANEAT
jgi:adenine-specific DNA-methyltransferase